MGETTGEGRPAPARARRARRVAAVAGALFVVYAGLGFLAAPPILRSVLVKQASAALHREVAIAKVRVNPLALSVTLEGLAVRPRDGASVDAPFLAWDSLYVRLAPLRLLAGEVGLAEIRLVRPAVNFGLAADGTLSFQDLLPPPAPPGAPAKPAPPPAKARPAVVSVGHLSVEGAQVVFHDATVRPAFAATLGPLTFDLTHFRTAGGDGSPYSFAGATDAGETFRWTGTLSAEPLRSQGTLEFGRLALTRYQPYLAALPVEVRDGLLDLGTGYELEWGGERRVVRLSGGKAVLDRFAVGPRGVAAPPVALPRVEVTGVEADVLGREARVAEVALKAPVLRVLREADGKVELTRMIPPPAPAPKTPAPPWRWSVGALTVAGGTIAFEDRTPPRPVSLPLTDVAVRLAGLRSAPDATADLAASLTWAGRGKLAAKGTVKPLGNAALLDLDAADLDLLPLAPYLAQDLAARLAGGRAGAKAKVEVDASGAEPRWTFKGDVRLDGLAVAEEGNEELFRWRALEVTGVDAASTPPRASVRLVRLVEPRVRAYVWEDGTTSMARALAAKREAATAGEGKAASGKAAPAWRTEIKALEVLRGRATFLDRSVQPAAVVQVTDAEARITRLSSDPGVRSTVDVRLDVEGAPVRVAGTLNPLQTGAYTDLTITSAGVDLSPLDPYAGKFLGYGLRKGKLDLDLRYKVQDRGLAGQNVVKVNQLTLGEATNSPDATSIPVRFALALLQDKDGVILLDVPIEGKIDDPSFRLGKVIWRAILNVLVKVATSPFRALAALAGGGDADLSLVDFVPGTAEPAPSAKDRFSLLAKSLAQRPALSADLEGAADAEVDGAVLRRAALERSLRKAKAATLRPAPADLDEVRLAPDERARLVKAAFEAAFPAVPPRAGQPAPPPAAPPTPQEMEDRLAAAEPVPPDALVALAAERAQRAREALVAAGLDPARIFLAQGGGRAEKERGARVYFTVR